MDSLPDFMLIPYDLLQVRAVMVAARTSTGSIPCRLAIFLLVSMLAPPKVQPVWASPGKHQAYNAS